MSESGMVVLFVMFGGCKPSSGSEPIRNGVAKLSTNEKPR